MVFFGAPHQFAYGEDIIFREDMILGTDFERFVESIFRDALLQAEDEVAEIEADGIRHSAFAVHEQALDK